MKTARMIYFFGPILRYRYIVNTSMCDANRIIIAGSEATEIAVLNSINTRLASQATAANQTTGNTTLSTISTRLVSQATAANQTAGNTTLTNIFNAVNTYLPQQATAAEQTIQTVVLNALSTTSGLIYDSVATQDTIDQRQFGPEFFNSYHEFYSSGVTIDSSRVKISAPAGESHYFCAKPRAQCAQVTDSVFSAAVHSADSGSNTYIGMFDEYCGIFIGFDNAERRFCVGYKSNGAVTKTIRGAFNVDNLEGFDFTKTQLYRIRINWPAFAEFYIYGEKGMTLFHRYRFFNSEVPFIQYSLLPFAASVESVDTEQSMFLGSYVVRGRLDPPRAVLSLNTGVDIRTVTTTPRAIFAAQIWNKQSSAYMRVVRIEAFCNRQTADQIVRFTAAVLLANGDPTPSVNGTFVRDAQSVVEYSTDCDTHSGVEYRVLDTYELTTNDRIDKIVDPAKNIVSYLRTPTGVNIGSDYFVIYAQTNVDEVQVGYNVIIEEH